MEVLLNFKFSGKFPIADFYDALPFSLGQLIDLPIQQPHLHHSSSIAPMTTQTRKGPTSALSYLTGRGSGTIHVLLLRSSQSHRTSLLLESRPHEGPEGPEVKMGFSGTLDKCYREKPWPM